MNEMFLTFGKSQLTRDEMRIINGGNDPIRPGFDDDPMGECSAGSCGYGDSQMPCRQFDTQNGAWVCNFAA